MALGFVFGFVFGTIILAFVLAFLLILSFENPGLGLIGWAIIYLIVTNAGHPIVQTVVEWFMSLIILVPMFLIGRWLIGPFIGPFVNPLINAFINPIINLIIFIINSGGETGDTGDTADHDPAPTPPPRNNPEPNHTTTGGEETTVEPDLDLGPLNDD